MREVIPETAADYLRESGRVAPGRAIAAKALGWGVSNVVMLVEVEGEPPIVLKQARERLRTKALWVSRLERIWTERAALDLLADLLPDGVVPRVLFADPDNYLFAMACAPADSIVWKEQLLAGQADPGVARRSGEILGAIHAETVGHPALKTGALADTVVFDELRIEPFYRTIVRAHPDLGPAVGALTEGMAKVANPCFVHADFSPKNILVHEHDLTLVDFETAHAGDPGYDLGFLLSHLLLKAVRAVPNDEPYLELIRAFWNAYRDRARGLFDAELERRAVGHLGANALARVDGTSPVDYLDEPQKAVVRQLSRHVLLESTARLDEVLEITKRATSVLR